MSYRARPQPRRGRKDEPSQEKRRARTQRRSPRLHVAEESELQRASHIAKMLLVLLAVLLVKKALEKHLHFP